MFLQWFTLLVDMDAKFLDHLDIEHLFGLFRGACSSRNEILWDNIILSLAILSFYNMWLSWWTLCLETSCLSRQSLSGSSLYLVCHLICTKFPANYNILFKQFAMDLLSLIMVIWSVEACIHIDEPARVSPGYWCCISTISGKWFLQHT